MRKVASTNTDSVIIRVVGFSMQRLWSNYTFFVMSDCLQSEMTFERQVPEERQWILLNKITLVISISNMRIGQVRLREADSDHLCLA